MAKKVLIFFPHALKKNFGGAYSYLYYLKSSHKSNDVELTFLSDLISFEEEPVEERQTTGVKKLLKKLVPDEVIYSRRIDQYLKLIKDLPYKSKKLEKIDFNSFDAIHFHETVDVWRSLDLLHNYKGKIILTSHSPKPYHLELLEDVFELTQSQISKATYERLQMIDLVAFKKADIIVAPCEEALEAYKEYWQPFQKLVERKKKVFIPTGIEAPANSNSLIEVRKNFKIGESGFVVCFNGRHNHVKGYDLVIQSAKQLLNAYPDIYFLVTGKKDNPSLLKHERWIETGWTESPQDFVNAADLVIVPNRETYFDLNVLMALSLGKQLILSENGGNKYFRQFNSPAISFFDVEEQNALTEVILKVYAERKSLNTEGNRHLFQQHFTLNKFANAYNQFYLSV
jgi:glycosyltransferase involved in cell wall biosynthesis